MEEFTILIGGQAGFGIDTATNLLASIFNNLGYYIFAERDYPSVIRGSHTFSIIRVSNKPILSLKKKIDFILALNQETIDLHKDITKKTTTIIYDSDCIKSDGTPIAATRIVNEEKGQLIMRNNCIIGAFLKTIGIEWNFIENILKNKIEKEKDLNIKITNRGYLEAQTKITLKSIANYPKALLSGNEAVALGLLKANLDAYIAYPMTPSSNILHFLAHISDLFQIVVYQPESELSVIMMSLGIASAGKKVAVGTSGGGFCLMTEGLSFAGMAELPIVIIMGQRTGPSTGLPTYTGQGELSFVLSAGHGEFPRLIVAPGDAQDAYTWSCIAMNLAWKHQIPSIILTDKLLAESVYTFEEKTIENCCEEPLSLTQENVNYKRYQNTPSGTSPLAFYPMKDNVIKINSYEHDIDGITIEDQNITKLMQEKRKRKENSLLEDLEKYSMVNVYGNLNSKIAIVSFGSNKGVCMEVAKNLNIKAIHIQVLKPFPLNQFTKSMKNVEKLISIENNIDGQLSNLITCHGFKVASKILKYDGRSFNIDDLQNEIQKAQNELKY